MNHPRIPPPPPPPPHNASLTSLDYGRFGRFSQSMKIQYKKVAGPKKTRNIAMGVGVFTFPKLRDNFTFLIWDTKLRDITLSVIVAHCVKFQSNVITFWSNGFRVKKTQNDSMGLTNWAWDFKCIAIKSDYIDMWNYKSIPPSNTACVFWTWQTVKQQVLPHVYIGSP